MSTATDGIPNYVGAQTYDEETRIPINSCLNFTPLALKNFQELSIKICKIYQHSQEKKQSLEINIENFPTKTFIAWGCFLLGAGCVWLALARSNDQLPSAGYVITLGGACLVTCYLKNNRLEKELTATNASLEHLLLIAGTVNSLAEFHGKLQKSTNALEPHEVKSLFDSLNTLANDIQIITKESTSQGSYKLVLMNQLHNRNCNVTVHDTSKEKCSSTWKEIDIVEPNELDYKEYESEYSQENQDVTLLLKEHIDIYLDTLQPKNSFENI